MHGVTFLGLGSLALLRPRAARGLLLALSPLFLWGLYLVASAPLDFARLPEPYAPLGAAFPPPGLTSPRLWTLPFNLLGTLLMAGVALYTTLLFRRQNPLRARGTALILLATLVLASTSALNRFGVAGPRRREGPWAWASFTWGSFSRTGAWPMRVGALDVGEARIGLAVGEEGVPLASGRGYLVRKTLEEDVEALLDFVRREGLGKLVVGLPLRTDLKESAQAGKVLPLVEALRARGVEVELWDERFTTKLAQERLKHAPKRLRRDKGKLDELAAVVLLEDYLARGI